MSTKDKKPQFASINWASHNKWDEVIIDKKDIGINQKTIDLYVKYAKKQGVKLEWLEYDEYVKFIVVGKSKKIGQAEKAPEYADALYKEIEEFGGETPNTYLRTCLDIPYSIYKAVMDDMVDNNRIIIIERAEGRGRPKIYYDIALK